jgi:hypothetical protein
MVRYAFRLSLLKQKPRGCSKPASAYGRLLAAVAATGGSVGGSSGLLCATVADAQAARFERLAVTLLADFGVQCEDPLKDALAAEPSRS